MELATRYLEERIHRSDALTSPVHTSRFLCARLRSRPHEVFACLFLDNRHRVICFEEMFRGTIDGASVHPREVAKRALELNAAALIAAHNHPSGVAEPSLSDRSITDKLRDALALVDVRLPRPLRDRGRGGGLLRRARVALRKGRRRLLPRSTGYSSSGS